MAVGQWYRVLRAQLNRVLIAVALLILLPIIAVAERVKPGRGRSFAVRAVKLVAAMCGVIFKVDKSDAIDSESPYVFVANHSSPLDIPAVLVSCPDIRFVAAAELFRIPLLAAAMKALATIPLERRDPALARRQLADFARSEGTSKPRIAIFPEGGIAPRGGRLPFKSGAFALAIETGAAVVPIAIHGTDVVLPPHRYMGVRPGMVTVQLMEPVRTTGRTVEDRGELRDEIYEIIASALDAGPI
jgi:1-acyl-sn-glycerol-3-phosphate acyltransferase